MNRLLGLGATALLVWAAHGVVTPGAAAAADDVTITLVDQPYAIAVDAPWTATFAVDGELPAATAPPTTAATATSLPTTAPAATPTPRIEARVRVHRPVETRQDLREVLLGRIDPVLSRVAVPVTPTTTADGSTFAVSVPTTNDTDVSGALVMARPGVYPLTVDLAVDGAVVATHRTLVERLAPTDVSDDEPLRIAVVAGVADPGPDAASGAMAEAGRAVEGIAAAAAALDGPMSVQFPPDVVAALDDAALGDVRTSLAAAEVLAAPALALDPSSAVAADLGATFSEELRNGEDVLGAALPATPPQRSGWLAVAPLSSPAATLLREPLGYDLLVVPQDDYDGFEGNIAGYHDTTLAFRAALDDGSTLPGMVVHPASRWLDPDETAAHGMSGVDGAIAVMAELRVTRSELGPGLRRSAVLAAPVGVVPDPDLLRALGTYAAATPDTQLATLTEVPGATDVQVVPDRGAEVVRLPATAGVDLTERVARIDVVRVDATAAGSMPLDPAQAEAWNAELDQLVSTNLDDAEVDASLAGIAAETQALYDCVALPNPFTFTLTGRSSTLRLNLTNQCAEDLGVVVHASSAKLTFPDGDVARTLTANSVTEVEIEVESRSNGTSAISVDVLTPVGSLPVQDPLVLTARVNALSGLGQLVTGGALLVLISWWYGHFRRRRRIRRALIGEVDNPVHVGTAVSPDAAEAVVEPPDDAVPAADELPAERAPDADAAIAEPQAVTAPTTVAPPDEPVPTPGGTDSVSEP